MCKTLEGALVLTLMRSARSGAHPGQATEKITGNLFKSKMPQQTGQVQVYPPLWITPAWDSLVPLKETGSRAPELSFYILCFFCSDYPFPEDQSSPCHAHSGTALILFAVQSSKTNNEQVNRSAECPHPLSCF